MPHFESSAIIHTAEFSLRPSVHAKFQMERMVTRYWFLPAIPTGILLMCGLADWRWWIVALALILIIMPMILMFAWIAVLGNKDAIKSVYPHTISISPDAYMTVTYSTTPNPTTGRDGDAIPPAQITGSAPADEAMTAQMITGLRLSAGHIIIRHTDASPHHRDSRQSHLLIIPAKAFAHTAEATEFIRRIEISCDRRQQACKNPIA